jgi:hypothetical protein
VESSGYDQFKALFQRLPEFILTLRVFDSPISIAEVSKQDGKIIKMQSRNELVG